MAFKKARSFRARRKVTINVVGTCKRKVTKSWYSSNITNIQPLKEALLVNNKVVEKNDLCIKVADILNQKYGLLHMESISSHNKGDITLYLYYFKDVF
ncbi:uncharacterized protein LOC136095380 isoform X4 [Hydra vulgaris]|uniref:uncharacterized protein LOC136095380 isoform X4 n=1 Tax=Hydra vulgaris TaxID=6087 RepID=UPI0032EA1C78